MALYLRTLEEVDHSAVGGEIKAMLNFYIERCSAVTKGFSEGVLSN